MRIQWLLVVLLVACIISGECARRRRGQRRNARRNKVRQRMKTTTEPPKPEPETEKPEAEPEKWEKEDGGDLDEVSFDLAKRFFNGFDDDNIFEEPDPNLLVNEPEVVNFKASFPSDEKELLAVKGTPMIFEKVDNDRLMFNESIARDVNEEIQANFISSKSNKFQFASIDNTQYNLRLGATYSIQVKLNSREPVNMGDMEVKYFMGDQRSDSFYINNLEHGWKKECLEELISSNTQSKFYFEGATVCTRSYGFLKIRKRIDRSNEAMFFSIVCIETLTSRSIFGKIVCVSTPETTSWNKQDPNKYLCSFDTVRYFNDKQHIDTIVDLNDEEASLSNCPPEHREDIRKIIFVE